MMIKTIEAKAAYEAIQQGAVLVDVREKEETEEKWVDLPGVVKLPYSGLEGNIAVLPSDKPLIVCCAVGIVSEMAVPVLHNHGYTNVQVLENGLVSWQEAHLPIKSSQDMHCHCNCGKAHHEK
ncbi:MAG: rhodanese-like domain-containing protein [Bacteroidales bacterium]|nr:rhodanese-like domain-containing protein [Bacteroidales bacterium]